MMSRKPMICLASSSYHFTNANGLVMLFLILIISNVSSSYGGNNETDYQALVKFKSMITKDPYDVLTSSWNDSFHFCEWGGVSCDKRHKRVVSVDLWSKGLEGSLSPHVGNLTFLRAFLLFNNSFEGSIPHELGRLSRLRFLYLDINKFSGVIPTNLSRCSNLEELCIGTNKLVGSIPKEFGFLSKVKTLILVNNLLTGGIPPSIGNMTSMERFRARGNPLGGCIPHTLGHLKHLREIYCGECNLHGTIPDAIYNLSVLTDLSLFKNRLTGSLPSSFGTMLPRIVNVQLRQNQLSGLLPRSISNCSKLERIEMSENNFSGKVLIDFAKLRYMFTLFLGDNPVGRGEADEMKFIESLKNCSRLEVLDLRGCNYQGELPRSIGNLSSRLRHLDLRSNQLHGNLPSGLGNLVGLSNLHLGFNRFTGKIPSTIGMLKNLQELYLFENQFSREIPDELGNLSLLTKFNMRSNKLEGHIPSSLGDLHNLLGLDLSDNKLSGEIPKELLQLSSLCIILDLSQNRLYGSLPTEVGELKMLNWLDLSYNNLSGNIPTSLDGCTSLYILSLNANLFQGMIPPSLSSLRGLVSLDLSSNNISGQIPLFLEHFLLEYLNLSFNDFVGEVPVLGVFANATIFSVLGNSRLCGGLVELGLPKCKERKHHKNKFLVLVIVILIASALFTILCLVYTWRKKKSKSQPSRSFNTRFLKVSYNQLVMATNGFSEANLIGRGGFSSVYKGILDSDDGFVAIKVLHLQIQGANRSFDAECEAWRSIRHRNLLKIITSCSSVDFQGNDFKALVYEFMPNGSLHDWLHSSSCTTRLDLLQRMHILIDVACALDYLHNNCLTPIVHGDLKPSNILLDDYMVAHVGDFGLSRFLGTNSNQNNSMGIRGTIGYTPPEYGLGNEMTASGDVYSFGVLLLEVMTGKRPTDDIFNNGLSLHKYAYMALPDHVTHVIDGELINYHQDDAIAMQCLASVVKIGVSCSVDSQPQRMNIRNVVQELQSIMNTLQSV